MGFFFRKKLYVQIKKEVHILNISQINKKDQSHSVCNNSFNLVLGINLAL